MQVETTVRSAASGAPTSALAEERPVYLIPFYYGEVGVTNRLRRLIEAAEDRLAAFRVFDWPAAFAALADAKPACSSRPRQMEAVQAALTPSCRRADRRAGHRAKRPRVRSIIRLAEAAGARTVLASPTGRAAKRLSEATGRPAKTIHRLLEFKPAEGLAFQRNEENPLEADLVIVDEASMLDLLLTNHLLKAIPPGAHLLLVGDVDQLPSVGAGNVLHDVIAAIERRTRLSAEARPAWTAQRVIRLDTIFRQPEGSYIITNAHRINAGPDADPGQPQRRATFFLFQEEDPEKAADLMVELVQSASRASLGCDPTRSRCSARCTAARSAWRRSTRGCRRR